MNHRSLLLLYLFLCQIGSSKSRHATENTYQLFSLPPFLVNLTLGSTATSVTSVGDLGLGSIVQEATKAHLEGYFESILDVSESGDALSDIQLIVESVDNTSAVNGFIANVSGEVSFYGNLLNQLDCTLDELMVEEWVRGAFSSATGGGQSYSNLIQDLLNTKDVRVDIDVLGAGSLIGGNIGAYSSNEDVIVNHSVNPNTTVEGGDKDSKNIIGVPVLMGVALVGFLAGMFVYWKQDKRQASVDGHLLLSGEEYSDYSEEDNRLSGELEFDEGLYESYDEEDGIQFIPVPAKFDDHPMDKKTKAVAKDVMPKRYVKPASPFEILYGAAFSHRDQAKVARAHGMKKQSKTIKVSGQKIRRKEPLKPMNTISESDDEDEVVKAPPSESFFPQIMSSISSFIEKRAQSSSVDHETLEEEVKKEDFVVYRDFPRHDGTPCVMFSPLNDTEWDTNATQTSLTPAGDNTTVGDAAGPHSPYKSPEQHKHIDNFVDKLENLMAARSRQYEERKRMDMELAARKKARMAERNKAKEDKASDAALEIEDVLLTHSELSHNDSVGHIASDEVPSKVSSDGSCAKECQQHEVLSVEEVASENAVGLMENTVIAIKDEMVLSMDGSRDESYISGQDISNDSNIDTRATESEECTDQHTTTNATEMESKEEVISSDQAIVDLLSLPKASSFSSEEEYIESCDSRILVATEIAPIGDFKVSQNDSMSPTHATSLGSEEAICEEISAKNEKEYDLLNDDDPCEGVARNEEGNGEDDQSESDEDDSKIVEKKDKKKEEKITGETTE